MVTARWNLVGCSTEEIHVVGPVALRAAGLHRVRVGVDRGQLTPWGEVDEEAPADEGLGRLADQQRFGSRLRDGGEGAREVIGPADHREQQRQP
jgi:hypothetical protein